MATDKDKVRKIVGYSLLGLGGLSLIVGVSPLFPIYFGAYLMFAVFGIAGAAVLAGKEISLLLDRAQRAFGREKKLAIDPILPVKVLSLAKAREGNLTVAETAISLKIPIEQAEAALEALVRNGTALQDYDVTQGFTRYRFPEFLPPDARRELLE